MTLVSPASVLEAGYDRPLRFDGSLAITAMLKDGPLTDLNLMFDPALCDGEMTPVHGRDAWRALLLQGAEVGAAARVYAGDTGSVDDWEVELWVAVLVVKIARVVWGRVGGLGCGEYWHSP